jgi:hypothetical protein
LRIIAPYATIPPVIQISQPAIPRPHPKTDEALRLYAPDAERVDVSGSLRAYSELLCRVWADGKRFLVVEHDIEIGPTTVREATYCPHPWCVWPYNGPGWESGPGGLLRTSTGCVKFSGAMVRAEPDLMDVASKRASNPIEAGDWHRMDVCILDTLRERGYADPHWHGTVLHHHHYPLTAACACGATDCPL